MKHKLVKWNSPEMICDGCCSEIEKYSSLWVVEYTTKRGKVISVNSFNTKKEALKFLNNKECK